MRNGQHSEDTEEMGKLLDWRIRMNLFSDVKTHINTQEAARQYGLEINRYESKVVSAYFVDYAFFRELCYVSDSPATISQTLFNDDEEYEFILPVMGLITESDYSEHEHIQRIYYRYKTIGYKIVSEDGRILQEIIVNEARDNNVNTGACVMQFGDNAGLNAREPYCCRP